MSLEVGTEVRPQSTLSRQLFNLQLFLLLPSMEQIVLQLLLEQGEASYNVDNSLSELRGARGELPRVYSTQSFAGLLIIESHYFDLRVEVAELPQKHLSY